MGGVHSVVGPAESIRVVFICFVLPQTQRSKDLRGMRREDARLGVDKNATVHIKSEGARARVLG